MHTHEEIKRALKLIELSPLWGFIFMKQFLRVYHRRPCGRFKVCDEILIQLEEVMRNPTMNYKLFHRKTVYIKHIRMKGF